VRSYENLITLRTIAQSFDLTGILQPLLNDERFPQWTGSPSQEFHHYGKGGLLEHTLEVTQLALLNARHFTGSKRVNERNLVCACICHDWGKIWDYERVMVLLHEGSTVRVESWQKAPHSKMIHHISRSALEFNAAARGKMPDADIESVTHAILAHHGQKAWGSPVSPKSPEAWLLHLCDSISARMDDWSTLER